MDARAGTGPFGRAALKPAPEGVVECALITKTQQERDPRERQLARCDIVLGDVRAHLIEQLGKRSSGLVQAALQRALMHSNLIRNDVDRDLAPSQRAAQDTPYQPVEVRPCGP